MCELIGFSVKTEKMITSEKTGRDDVENVVGPKAMFCRVPSHCLLEERLECRNIDDGAAKEGFRRQVGLKSKRLCI